MPRTGDLYSGITSTSRSKQLRQTVNRDNIAKKQILKPYAQVVFDEIEKLKTEELLGIMSFVLDEQDDDGVRVELAVRRESYHNLVQLQTRFTTILKSEPKDFKNETEL